MNLKRISFFVLVFASALTAAAQNLAQHNWYFGNSTNAIRFNRGTNKPSIITNKAVPFGTGGSAVATDPSNANLLFYTDGVNVYNANNAIMPNGTGLTANSTSNQPAVICPKPGDSTVFYIFTNTASYPTGGAISIDTVDMKLFGGSVFPAPALGDVKNPKNGALAVLINRSEGMLIIPHANGTDYWLITQQINSQSFAATLIDKTKTFPTTVTSGMGVPMSVANFAYNKKLKKVAASAQDPSTDAIILNFNDATGNFTFDRYIYNTGTNTTTNQSIYDIEWDNKGQYLYISRVGETGINADVLQYDYLNPNNTLASVLKTPEFRSWGLQLAPDSAIYHIYQAISGGPFLVEKFTKTDTIASSVIETTSPFGAIDFKGTQFPSFIPKISFKLGLSFTAVGTCQGNNTTFFPNVIPNADSLRWDLGDTTVTDWSPVHKYKTAQTYNVTLTAFYQGQKQTVTQPVTITSFDLKLTLPSDTTACHCQLPVNIPPSCALPVFSVKVKASGTNSSGATFTWSNGETGNTLHPNKAGYYYVVATDGSGCSSYAGVNVKEYGLQDQRSNIWYFGNNAGIDFNPPSGPVPLSGSNMDAPAGCAIVCDRNGQTIFYTDGDKVYDKTKTQIDLGIGGDPLSSQSSLIVPVPGDETLYYIFTTQSINGVSGDELRYSLFDLKLNNGKGALVKKSVLLFSKSTERITANDSWLIAHEYGNNTFRAYKITAGGLGDPVFSSIGSTHSFGVAANGQGYMKLGATNTLAVALSTPGTSNYIELFHLNDSTGMLSNFRQISLSNTAGQVYGIEFSGGGKKVFATVSGAASSDIYEYAIDSLGHTTLKRDSVFNVKLGALQVAPDNRIYVAIDNSTKLGTITPVDDIKLKSPIDMGTGFALAGGTNSRMGLPNFVQHQSNGFGGPGFTFTGTCLGDTTAFNGQSTDSIDKFAWSFGDNINGGNVSSPKHLYAKAGTYTVSMVLTNRCGLNVTITKQVTINPPPATPSINPHPSICAATGIVLDANTPNTSGLTYLWSTGDTTKTLTVLKPAFLISVTNTDKNGCHSTAMTSVNSDVTPVDLGADQTVCQNSAVAALDAQNAGNNYVWKVNGTTSSTSQFQAVDTTVPGVFTYTVTVTNPITGCVTNAKKVFTVIQSPAFTMSGTNPTSCSATDGKINLTGITSPHLYSYFITGPGGFNKQGIDIDPAVTTSVGFTGPPDAIGAGTYSGIVTDQVSGCTISNSYGLSGGTFTVTPSIVSKCDPPVIKITTTASNPWNYLITNGTTGATTNGGPVASNNVQVNLPSQGAPGTTNSYTVQVTDAANCVVTSNALAITTTVVPVLTIASNLCANPATLTASGGSTYAWTGPAISGSASGATVNITAGGTYSVTSTSGGCSVTQNTTVTYNGPFTPDFTFDPCQDQVVFVASPVGANFTYRWYENGAVAPNNSYVGQQVFAGPAPYNKNVVLEITDSQSGCIKKSTSKSVQVIGKLTASLTSTLACDDGKAFTLTATTNGPSPTYAWSLNGATIAGATSATTQQTSAGTYNVDITQSTCKASASLQIIKSPIPQGVLAVRYQICNDPDNHDPKTKTVDLDPGSFSAYNWFKNDVQLSPPVTKEVYTADSEGNYRVDLTNTFGCVASDKTVVINDCEPIIAGPNVFRPSSGTAENTTFHLYTFYITTFEIIVYNRWGEPIYESKDEKFKWNGGYNNNPGQPVPGDTYTYLVRYTSSFHPERGVQEQRGGVILLR